MNYIILILLVLLNDFCASSQEKKEKNQMKVFPYTNALISESSPYLLEHAHNPVNWYPWGEEALEKAKKENKLIIISIGYSSCHWCHVMMHENFEDTTVARVMNENYIAIKVDREERPDIDQVYMHAVQLLTGSGGWPLNVIALPDGRPIYGGTYFSKENWLKVLNLVSEYANKNPDKTEEQAEALTNGVKSVELINITKENIPFNADDLKTIYNNWKGRFDHINGGYAGAPKFPVPVGYQFLLHYNYLTGDQTALTAVTTTLDKMADGGIYDQIGGGFARYSTDAYWRVPHFEKMLYDNAQLVSLYSTAYQITKDSRYKNIVYGTLDFVERELTSKEGGFYSSLDADSEGEEGKFYVWTKEEIRRIPGNDAGIISDYFSITDKGNWEKGKNILYKSISDKKIAEKYKITETELAEKISSAEELMFKERSKRVYPATDDKILTGWNALMLKGYIDAYRVFNEQKFLDAALKNAEFILHRLKTTDGKLFRNYKNGKASVNAFLDDYALTIDAFISLYQITFDEKWLDKAQSLTDYTLKHFYDSESGMFYYTSDLDPALIARKMEILDNVIPSANSVIAKDLFILGSYFSIDEYINKSGKMINNVRKDALRGGANYANWDILMTWFVKQPYEVAIAGENYPALLKEFNNYYLPDAFFYGGKDEKSLSLTENKLIPGQTTIYVCQNKTC
ncbi:MAG: thioredoxin domain-containing protein, partial [Bacteroidales bacterium]|nr:thioredoxin domain-containing protein [Bacteroidales bacterium]